MKITAEHVGKRVLVNEEPCGYRYYPLEAIVLEISPNGYIKLRWPVSAVEVWYGSDRWSVLEVLG